MTRFRTSISLCLLLFSFLIIFETKAQNWQTVTPKIFIQVPLFSWNSAVSNKFTDQNSCRPGIDYSIYKNGSEVFNFSLGDNTVGEFANPDNNHPYNSFIVFPEGEYSFRFKNTTIANNHNEAWVFFDSSPYGGYYYHQAGFLTSRISNNVTSFYQQLGKNIQVTTPSYNLTNINPTPGNATNNLVKRFITNVRDNNKISIRNYMVQFLDANNSVYWETNLKNGNNGQGPWLPVNSLYKIKIYDSGDSNKYIILEIKTGAPNEFGEFKILDDIHGLKISVDDIWLSNFSYIDNGDFSQSRNFTIPSGVTNDSDFGKIGFLKNFKISPNVMWESNNSLIYEGPYSSFCGNTCTTPAPTISSTSTTAPATITASNCSGTINWSNGSTGSSISVSPTTTTTYTATCTAGGCLVSGPSNTIQVSGGGGSTCNINIAHVGSPPSDCLAGQNNTKSFGWIVNGNIYGNDLQRSTDNVNWSDGGSIWLDTSFDNYVYIRIKATPSSVGRVYIKANACGTQSVFTPCTTGGGTCTTPTPAPTISSTSTTAPATITASNCSGTINWSNGSTGSSITVSPTTTTTYTATCTAGGCPVSSASNPFQVSASGGGGSTCNINIAHVGSPPSDCLAGQNNTKSFGWIVNGNIYGNDLQRSTDNVNWSDGGSIWLNTSFDNYVYIRIKASPANVGRVYIKANACGTQSIFTPCSIGGACGTLPNPPTVSSNVTIYQGQNTTLTASGCGGTINWAPSLGVNGLVSPTITTNYVASCTVGGCVSAGSTVTVSVELPPIGITISDVLIGSCNGNNEKLASWTVSGGTSPYQIGWGSSPTTWYPFSGGSHVPANSDWIMVIKDAAGSKKQIRVVTNACWEAGYYVISNAARFGIVEEESVEIESEEDKISLFPNPTTDELNIEVKNEVIYSITINNLGGSKVLDQFNIAPNANKLKVNVSKLNSGLYFIQINTQKNKYFKKFMKNN